VKVRFVKETRRYYLYEGTGVILYIGKDLLGEKKEELEVEVR